VAVTPPVGAAPAPEPVVALDVASHAAAVALVDRLGPACGFYKIGLELFTAAGPAVVEALRARGLDVFLDLKLHDIPNTVAGAARSAGRLGVRLLTVHATGGAAMVRAAVDGFGPRSDGGVLAVTVLTSLDAAAVAAAWGRAAVEVAGEVLRLADVAAGAGAHGVVCSGHEAAAVRDRHAGRLATLVPGVRLAGDGAGDQRRVVTPAGAAAAGARYVVLGRTVTGAADPAAALLRAKGELALASRA
jgi:orotidine-5'-phosphate decarboxylase